MRYFARGKDNEQAAGLDVLNRSPDAAAVTARRVAEDVDGDQQIAQLGDQAQHSVGEEAHVLADAAEEVGEYGTLENAERVIRDNNASARARYVREVLLRDADRDLKVLEETRGEVRSLDGFVDLLELVDAEH